MCREPWVKKVGEWASPPERDVACLVPIHPRPGTAQRRLPRYQLWLSVSAP